MCGGAGLTFSGEVPSLTIVGMPTGLAYSAAIGYLAALCGANACMDREGCLVFRQFEESGQVLGTDDCYSGGMVFKTSDFTVASLTNTLETETTGDNGETTTETVEVERTTGAAGGSIALTNPLMTEDNIDTAWDVVKGFIYRPATLTAVGQLAVDVGDVLIVTDATGAAYSVPVMTHNLEYDGGLKSTITAAGESESQQSAAVSGPMAQQIKELTTKVTDTKVLALGKNAVYYAAAAPSADDYTLSVNDLWFDTSGGDYAMYYWDGSAWVAAPFGTSALGDDIITAAKIVAGAVTAEKLNVSELSAITANLGTVTAGDITGTTFTTTGELGYTKLSGGTVTSLGNTATMAEIPDFEEDGSSLEVTGQPYFDMDGGIIDLYAYGTALRASQLGGLRFAATGIYGYPGTLNAVDEPWFRFYNPSKVITINGTLDVTGEATVNNFRAPEIQRGYVDVTPSAAGERTSAAVTFDTAFSGTPTVTATVQTTAPDSRAAGVLSISATGFTVYVYSSGSGTVRVHWIAVY